MTGGGPLAKVLSVAKYLSGQFEKELVSFSKQQGAAVVLCYHRVTPTGSDGATELERGVSVDTFRQQMEFMMSFAEPIRACDALIQADGAPRFAVTFDDGTSDNIEIATPVLEAMGVPGTFYIVSDFVGTDKLYWWEELSILMRGEQVSLARLSAIVEEAGAIPLRPVPTDSEDFHIVYEAISSQLRLSDPAVVDAAMDAVATAFGKPRRRKGRPFPLMDWDDVRDLQARGHDIGNHTRTHPNLSSLHPQHLDTEIIGAADIIEHETGVRPRSFAYPYGIERATDDALEAILGAETGPAFSTGPGFATATCDPNRVPRVLLNRTSKAVWAHNLLTAKHSTAR